jgi:oxaloacetate decarboxylase alpha subunit
LAAPAPAAAAASGTAEVYTVRVNGQSYVVEVAAGGEVSAIASAPAPTAPQPAMPTPTSGEPLAAPLAGNIFKVNVGVGDPVAAGDVVVILEAMKMETEVRAASGGTVASVNVKVGDSVAVGDTLISVG